MGADQRPASLGSGKQKIDTTQDSIGRWNALQYAAAKGMKTMKAGIHPEYHEIEAQCACGQTFRTRSTAKEVRVELCSQCHPFFTGKQKLVDTAGRVERFQRRYRKAGTRTRKKDKGKVQAAAESQAGDAKEEA